MKQSQLYILIANIFVAGSFLTNHVWDSIAMFFIGGFWLLGAVFCAVHERLIEHLEKRLQNIKFNLIVDLLSEKKRRKNG
jgi:hypothetical protein